MSTCCLRRARPHLPRRLPWLLAIEGRHVYMSVVGGPPDWRRKRQGRHIASRGQFPQRSPLDEQRLQDERLSSSLLALVSGVFSVAT